MVLDPLSALGVVSNVAQLIEFFCKLLSESRELYNSVDGASAEHQVLEDVTLDLSRLGKNLISSYEYGTASGDGELYRLVSQSKEMADELLRVLEQLKAKGSKRIFKSFVQAVRTVGKKGQIEGFERRLDKLRGQLIIRLLVMMRDQQSSVMATLRTIEEESKMMETDRAQKLQQLKSEVLASITGMQPGAQLDNATLQELLSTLPQKPLEVDDMMELSIQMKQLSKTIASLGEEGRAIASEQTLLKSLCFRSMKVRHANVAAAHAKTFDWVFAPSSSLKFVDWLQSQNGIYWITGKAGAGKSTLMKFLCHDPRTHQALLEWAANKKLITAQHFFWNAGTEMQKSQEGLLQSLLFEILRQCPGLIPVVCSSKLAASSPYQNEFDSWTRSELLETVIRLIEQVEVPAKFCFFIDGLDEYNGDHFELISVMKLFPISKDIKICLSSRPWYIFKDAFGQSAERKLSLELLTRDDIRLYVRNRLEGNERFRQLKSNDERCQELVQEIVDNAQGVFLWVVLVVRSLLEGLTYADRISDLQRRLRLLPQTLEDFFGLMFSSVEKVYKQQAAQTFQICLQARQPLSLITLSFIDDGPKYAFGAVVQPLGSSEITTRQEDMRRRLDGRCKGLLEVIKDEVTGNSHSGFGSPNDLKVDFLHRTARDFLLTKDIQTMLAHHVEEKFNANVTLCRAYLVHMKRVYYYGNQRTLDEFVEEFIYYAREAEIETGLTHYTIETDNETRLDISQGALLIEAENVLSGNLIPWKGSGQKNAFLGFAIQRGLLIFVAMRLDNIPELIRADGRPLLDFALQPLGSKMELGIHRPEMVQMLLRRGASPNQTYEGSTVWGRFMASLYKGGRPSKEKTQITEMLLLHGANPGKRVNIAWKYQNNTYDRYHRGRRTQLIFRNSSSQHSSSQPCVPITASIPIYMSARKVILARFTETEAQCLLRKATNRAFCLFGWLCCVFY